MKKTLIILSILCTMSLCIEAKVVKKTTRTNSTTSAITSLPTDVVTNPSELSGKALEWYNLAKDGNAEAQYELACCFSDGIGAKKDFKKALYWANKAAQQNYPAASRFIAIRYEEGEGVKKNIEKAKEWFSKAYSQAQPLAENGDPTAQNVMGLLYECGNGGVDKDLTKAFEWYRKSAEQGYALAQFNLGYCYESGEGVTKDLTEAVKWYRKSAEQGDASAQNKLGDCYKYGKGVTKDYTEAVKWYRKSAEQGNAIAQCNLGYCYDNGEGVTKDLTEAVKWYRKSAEQGCASAQFNLGYCYEKGIGVATNEEQAKLWYKKAADQGDEFAQDNLKSLEGELGNQIFYGTTYYGAGSRFYWYSKNGKYGVYDNELKKIVINPIYDNMWSGWAVDDIMGNSSPKATFWVKDANGRRGLLNQNGKLIIPYGKYEVYKPGDYYSNDFILVKSPTTGKIGAINYNGVVIVHVKYEFLWGMGGGRLFFSNDSGNTKIFYVYDYVNGRLLASKSFVNNYLGQRAGAQWLLSWGLRELNESMY